MKGRAPPPAVLIPMGALLAASLLGLRARATDWGDRRARLLHEQAQHELYKERLRRCASATSSVLEAPPPPHPAGR